MSSLESKLNLDDLTTTDGEPIDDTSAWHIYVEPTRLLEAIELVDVGAVEVFPVQIAVLHQIFPDPRNALISPVPGTYIDSLDPRAFAHLTALEVLLHPFAVKATLLQPDSRNDQHVLCIIDHRGSKGLMWFIAQEP